MGRDEAIELTGGEVRTARPRLRGIDDQRAIIDRRILIGEIEQIIADNEGKVDRGLIIVRLQAALEKGRTEIARRLFEKPTQGHRVATAYAFLTDQIVRICHDIAVNYQYPVANRSAGERVALIAVGGYGRGEMALYSDVDIGFIIPFKQTSWTESIIEAVLYWLWDIGFKVGQSVRSIDDTIRQAKRDLTIRTALLEGRFICGDTQVYEAVKRRFFDEVVIGTRRKFVSEKLDEREQRHKKMGDSRYVVEPNVKEGKGGLRDLHTLYWIGKYIHRVTVAEELVDVGLLSHREFRRFHRAANFHWAIRCLLHILTNRAQERLTFDLQHEIAEKMQFKAREGKSSVERFMQYYFLTAKTVGDLTGHFLTHLDEAYTQQKPTLFRKLRRKPRKLNGFILERGRLGIPHEGFFQEKPVRLIEIFHLADKFDLELHSSALLQIRRDARRIGSALREDKRANALFLDILTSKRDPETVLRWLNESSVFGHFIPDFGKVVAQMQFDMYHHYTVDEHSIRAIGLLSRIENGQYNEDHPIASRVIKSIKNRRALYVATLLHDIAKGRGGDHSILGAEVAQNLCPRFGLEPHETELVAWLVRNHLLMSATAFKRDLTDFKTIQDFVHIVKSVERLRLLITLTIVDIRAVGPGVWNGWKRQLLGDLYEAAQELLRPGHKQRGRSERIAEKKAKVRANLVMGEGEFNAIASEFRDSYWVAEPEDIIARNLELMRANKQAELAVDIWIDEARSATYVTVLAADHPGIFYRIAGGIHLAGGNIIDARIHTTRNGMAIDNFLVQNGLGEPLSDMYELERLRKAVGKSLVNKAEVNLALSKRAPAHNQNVEIFNIVPMALIDNNASNRFTVIEVNAPDRPALLTALAKALFDQQIVVHSAHIATYGERAVDTFYVTDLLGAKLSSGQRMKQVRQALIAASSSSVI